MEFNPSKCKIICFTTKRDPPKQECAFRAVARFFCNGGWGHYRECRRHEPCMGVSGYTPPENFQVWSLRNSIFSTCHERCLRKIDLEYENGKQLQVTVIKITESKENNSIHRLDVSGLTGPGGVAAPLSHPLATALVFCGKVLGEVESHPYLGVALDNKMRRSLHIEVIISNK